MMPDVTRDLISSCYAPILGVLIEHLESIDSIIYDLYENKNNCPENVSTFISNFVDEQFATIDNETKLYEWDRKLISIKKKYNFLVSPYHEWDDKSYYHTLSNDLYWKLEFIGELNYFAEKIGNLSNTCLFRHIKIKNRKISIINQKLPQSTKTLFSDLMKKFADDMYDVYEDTFLSSGSPIRDSILGFIKDRSYVDHAKEHINCRSAIAVDISKFYDSISLNSIIRNNLIGRAHV